MTDSSSNELHAFNLRSTLAFQVKTAQLDCVVVVR